MARLLAVWLLATVIEMAVQLLVGELDITRLWETLGLAAMTTGIRVVVSTLLSLPVWLTLRWFGRSGLKQPMIWIVAVTVAIGWGVRMVSTAHGCKIRETRLNPGAMSSYNQIYEIACGGSPFEGIGFSAGDPAEIEWASAERLVLHTPQGGLYHNAIPTPDGRRIRVEWQDKGGRVK